MKRSGKICFAAATLLFLALLPIARGQIFEDRMDPDEIGILDIDSLVTPSAVYVGNEICMTCHPAAYRKWLGTEHARAFVPMRSMMGMMMGETAGVTACCPAKSGKCLPCHATAHNVPAAYRGPEFRMGEGVSCEKCHGPGGDHVEAAGSEGTDPKATIRIPSDEDCMACHKYKPSHEMVSPEEPFSMEEAHKRIAHKAETSK
jgi:hypothetical protein